MIINYYIMYREPLEKVLFGSLGQAAWQVTLHSHLSNRQLGPSKSSADQIKKNEKNRRQTCPEQTTFERCFSLSDGQPGVVSFFF